jgi:hypothetical protein
MNQDFPEWAKVRACELANLCHAPGRHWRPEHDMHHSAMKALARMVQQYEKEPVEPDVLAVRAVLAAFFYARGEHDIGDAMKAGEWDCEAFTATLAAYREHKPK